MLTKSNISKEINIYDSKKGQWRKMFNSPTFWSKSLFSDSEEIGKLREILMGDLNNISADATIPDEQLQRIHLLAKYSERKRKDDSFLTYDALQNIIKVIGQTTPLRSFNQPIPNLIHLIWFGYNCPHLNNILKLKRLNLKHRVILWTKKQVSPNKQVTSVLQKSGIEVVYFEEDQYCLENKKLALEAIKRRSFSEGSDILRIDLARHYGGIYVDVKVKAIKSFPCNYVLPFGFSFDFSVQLDRSGSVRTHTLHNCFLASVPHHPVYIAAQQYLSYSSKKLRKVASTISLNTSSNPNARYLSALVRTGFALIAALEAVDSQADYSFMKFMMFDNEIRQSLLRKCVKISNSPREPLKSISDHLLMDVVDLQNEVRNVRRQFCDTYSGNTSCVEKINKGVKS